MHPLNVNDRKLRRAALIAALGLATLAAGSFSAVAAAHGSVWVAPPALVVPPVILVHRPPVYLPPPPPVYYNPYYYNRPHWRHPHHHPQPGYGYGHGYRAPQPYYAPPRYW